MEKWTAADMPDQTGRTVVVTGANRGLGLEMVRVLAERGAHVVMTARDLEKGRAAAARVSGSVEARVLDLADLDSIARFAAGIERADVLINNAAAIMTPRDTTEQGFELQLGTNHLGPFALTAQLYPVLREGKSPRIVTASSAIYKQGKIDFDDLGSTRSYSPSSAYARSKLASTLFALELDRRLQVSGSPVLSVLSHPGYTASNPGQAKSLLLRLGDRLMAQNVTMGALGALYAATNPGVQGGEFYGPVGMGGTRGFPMPVKVNGAATDPALARRMWEVSEKLTAVPFPV
ncbi:oxidoreductase [Isoptericola sp. NPDC056573]|uniref:oxidoreductase n=1 Tax=Isoptericola sp. NPDC056573 TaxID=3345868 RepID=UPI0036847DDC